MMSKAKCYYCAKSIEGNRAWIGERCELFCSSECWVAQQDFNRLNEKVYATLEWTNVKDALPVVSQGENYYPGQRDSFLVACSEEVGRGLYGFGYRRVVAEWLHHDQQWYFSGLQITKLVTHWCPIPGLPIQAEPENVEVGRCSGCQHWHRKEQYYEALGICDADNKGVLFTQRQDEKGPPAFVSLAHRLTSGNWGCIQFQPREE